MTGPDFTRMPGVYIVPGTFVPQAERKPREPEAWERYRNRIRRWLANTSHPKEPEPNGKGK
jgi:hypothetical protein